MLLLIQLRLYLQMSSAGAEEKGDRADMHLGSAGRLAAGLLCAASKLRSLFLSHLLGFQLFSSCLCSLLLLKDTLPLLKPWTMPCSDPLTLWKGLRFTAGLLTLQDRSQGSILYSSTV